jgi:hypothetical protein
MGKGHRCLQALGRRSRSLPDLQALLDNSVVLNPWVVVQRKEKHCLALEHLLHPRGLELRKGRKAKSTRGNHRIMHDVRN